jgi:hypothetical protein
MNEQHTLQIVAQVERLANELCALRGELESEFMQFRAEVSAFKTEALALLAERRRERQP